MRHLSAIDFTHVNISIIGMLKGIATVGIAITEFYEGCVWCGAYAGIIILPCPLSTGASLVICQGIDNFGCDESLLVIHVPPGYVHDIVICETCILNTIVEVCSKNKWKHIMLRYARFMTIEHSGIGNHIKMERIGMMFVIGLIDTGMQVGCCLTYLSYNILVQNKGLLKL